MPQTLGISAPQVLGKLQLPHCRSPPQPSATGPHALGPKSAHVFALHDGAPQTPDMPPPPHAAGGAHVPQSSTFPQPSPAGPQLNPRLSHVIGVHVDNVPHWPGPPPPHVSPPVQVPQSSRLPQPSPAGPHPMFWSAHVFAEQAGAPQTLGWPAPPHVVPAGQLPHCRMPPQPSAMGPQFAPASAQVTGEEHVPPSPNRIGDPPSPEELVKSAPPAPLPVLVVDGDATKLPLPGCSLLLHEAAASAIETNPANKIVSGEICIR
jgi:hypothetical protein